MIQSYGCGTKVSTYPPSEAGPFMRSDLHSTQIPNKIFSPDYYSNIPH